MQTKILNIKQFDGAHCETTALGTLLLQKDINLSEAMLFGLGQGLSFIYWNMKSMPCPFFGGRIKTDNLTSNITNALGLKLIIKETKSKTKAWENVKSEIDNGNIVGIKLDCFHLEYFSRPIHFAGHYVAFYGYDEEYAYLVDTRQQGGFVKSKLSNFALARSEKGPMSSNNLSFIIENIGKEFELKSAIINAIKLNAENYLNPPIKNISYLGIEKASNEIIKWFKNSNSIKEEFSLCAMLMEKAGTGGALFRNLYGDFLLESYEILGNKKIKTAYLEFIEIANLWAEVSLNFEKISQTSDDTYLKQASEILKLISKKEFEAMKLLSSI